MAAMIKETARAALVLVVFAASAPDAAGQPLTIYEIQSNTQNGDASVYDYSVYGDVVDCVGGVVVAKPARNVPRLLLQDPNYPDGWGGIQVKDVLGAGAFGEVEVGDWVSLANMEVEEFRGTTFLQWYDCHNPGLTVVSQGNPLPPPIFVSVSDIPAPIYDPNDGGWYVENRDAEPYESMRLIVRDVEVTEMDLGKASDNYRLENDPDDPNAPGCWAADYLNQDKPYSHYYHRFVSSEQHFCGVSGMLEQYTRWSHGFDYYQLLTLSSPDLAICGDVDHDGDVDLADLATLLANYGASSGATYEDGDFDYDGDVDLSDLATLLGAYGTTVP